VPPSCLYHNDDLSSETSTISDLANESFTLIDSPFTFRELESAIHSSRTKSSPGLDRFDYSIICSIPSDLLLILLDIYNELYAQGLFPDSWNVSLITFVPKPGGRGVRPIALLSCFLKLLEKMLYRRMQWIVETRFLLPDFQSGFRSFRSCADNLVVLTNRINSASLNKAPTLAVFLDIAGAFDNTIPQILIKDLRSVCFSVRFCKFIRNFLFERSIFAVRNGDLLGPFITHKGTP